MIYASIWNGRDSLHDLFVSPRDRLLFQYRGNALTDAAPGSGLPSTAEMQRQDMAKSKASVLRSQVARKGGHAMAAKRDAQLYARREKVAAMRREGKTLREMSRALMVSKETIVNDIRWLGLAKGCAE